MDGILCIDKPQGLTSRDVVNEVGKTFHTKKIGHTGTLDPLATGVLVLCMGSCSKLAELLTATEKEYEAEMILGIETDTLDVTGTLLKEETVSFTQTEIETVLKRFVGTYEQEVPAYSAVKVQGKKLYELARQGKKVELPKRVVQIRSLDLLSFRREGVNFYVEFRTTVSKGTYIRSLIRDIAAALHTVGVMSKLRRTRQGTFSLADCSTLETLKAGSYHLLTKEEVFQDMPKVIMSQELKWRVQNGQLLDRGLFQPPVFFVNDSGELKAIYQLYEKDETKIKPWKMF